MERRSRSHTPKSAKSNSPSSINISPKMSTTISNGSNKSGRRGRSTRKRRSKSHASIKKLFNHLRNESQHSFASLDNSVILVNTSVSPLKRKLSEQISEQHSKRRKEDNDASLIVIDDETTLVTNEVPCYSTYTPQRHLPVQCSTPIIKGNEPDFIPLVSKTSVLDRKSIKSLKEEIKDLTKEINADSYLTIDLTTETASHQNTVIDLESSVDADCTVVSISNTNLSMSGDSDVTVLNLPSNKKEQQMKKIAKGIARLDSSEKGRLLDLITQNIFNGRPPAKVAEVPGNSKETTSRAVETAEDTYIKEVILGQAQSRNSIGSNIYNPEKDIKNKSGLRMVVIDGSNVAMEHGKGKVFSVKGLKICIDYFLNRGHVVKAFVPRFRCKFGKSTEPRQLDELERRALVVYTPSREIQGRMITSYDDRYIVQCAAEFDAVIVSGDNYRDLLQENPRWRFVIENRLLPFTWVNDMIMFPRDPLGRRGPSLEQFLRHQP